MSTFQKLFPAYRIVLLILTGCFIWSQQFIGPTDVSPETYARIGAPYASDIFRGHFWGVLTNAIVHIHLWHFATSFLLLTLFGNAVEQLIGSWKFILLTLLGTLVTSCAQLAMSGDPGIGFYGTNAVYMGFLLQPKLRRSLGTLFWVNYLLICLSLLFIIGNIFFEFIPMALSAVFTGYMFGFLIGQIKQFRTWTLVTYLLSLAICISSLIYNPFSSEWHTVRGFQHYEEKSWNAARWHYTEALNISPKNHVAKTNLRLLDLAVFKEKAYQSHLTENYDIAIYYYKKVLELDPENDWAKNNLNTLQ